jgi:hypothetical protein
VAQNAACGASGCEGNQVCKYDPARLVAFCIESPEGCRDARDCVDARVCRAGQCAEPGLCVEDVYEPNDAQATPMAGAISATLCPGDVDRYGFDTTPSGLTQGALAVELVLEAEDRGIGAPTLVITTPQGREVVRVVADARGVARASAPITIAQRGVFELRVEGVAAAPGVRYRLSAQAIDAASAQACAAPVELVPGMSAQRSTLSGASSALPTACADAAGAIPEDVFVLRVAQPSYALVVARPQAGVDVALSLRASCLAAAGELCASRAGAGGAETIDGVLEPGDYYIIAQAVDAQRGGFYTLEATLTPAICTQADNSCKDANTASICNGRGTGFIDEACDNGCDVATRRCRRPPGDACYNAIPVSVAAPYIGAVSWSVLRDDVRVPDGACVPASGTITPVSGPDMVFAVDVPPSHVVIAELEDTGDNVALYAVRDCAQAAATCVAGVNASSFNDEVLVWRNDQMRAATLYVVADVRSDASYIDSDVSVRVVPAICQPGRLSCDASGQVSQRCDARGTSYVSSVTCRAGCDALTGACARPPEDTCAGAVEILSAQPVSGRIEDFTPNYTLTSAQSCTGFAVNGPEGVYKLSGVQAGERIRAVYDVGFDGSLWLTNRCDAMGAGACLVGSDRGNPETFEYIAPAAGDYYVMAAGYASSASGAYTLTVTRELPNCALGDGSVCAGPSTVSYCDAANFTKTLVCPTTCTSGQCDQRDGDTCYSAIRLVGQSGSVSGTFGGTNFLTLPAGVSGGCVVRNNQASSGPDRIYSVDLQAGDLLTVQLTTTLSTAHLYILESCRDLASCVINNPARGAATLTYHAQVARTVYVVVDASGATTTSYTLAHTITPNAACAPGRARCLDAQTLGQCAPDGSVEQALVCPSGCAGAACAVDVQATNTCGANTPDVGQGISVLGTFGAHTSSTNLTAASCVGATTPGPDVFYKATLMPGQGVSARAESFGAESPALYIFTNCAAPAASCLTGARRVTGTQRAEAFHINATQGLQTVYIALDSEQSSADEPFALQIGVYSPVCTPGQRQCATLPNGSVGSQVCLPSGAGFGAPEVCVAGCDAGTGLCFAAPGERCDTAIELVPNMTQTGDLANFKAASSGTCTEDDGTTFTASGRQAIYKVSGVAAGETLRARVASPASRDMVVWIAGDCTSGQLGACLRGQDDLITSTSPEIVTYQVPAAGDYYVIAQAYSSGITSGAFTVSVERLTPVCQAGQRRCATLANGSPGTQLCAADGLSWGAATACANGCDAATGACLRPPGDLCTDAIELVPGQPYSGALGGFQIDYALTSSACTGYSVSGRDAVFVLRNLSAGQQVRVTYTTPGYDGAVWVSGSCAANGQLGACLAGRDNTSGTTEVLTYTTTTAGDLYIVAAAYAAGGVGNFTLTAELLP